MTLWITLSLKVSQLLKRSQKQQKQSKMKIILLTHISQEQVIKVCKDNLQHKTLHFSSIEKLLYYDLNAQNSLFTELLI